MTDGTNKYNIHTIISFFISTIIAWSIFCSIIFNISRLIGGGSVGVIWYFSLSDYINTSPPIALYIVCISISVSVLLLVIKKENTQEILDFIRKITITGQSENISIKRENNKSGFIKKNISIIIFQILLISQLLVLFLINIPTLRYFLCSFFVIVFTLLLLWILYSILYIYMVQNKVSYIFIFVLLSFLSLEVSCISGYEAGAINRDGAIIYKVHTEDEIVTACQIIPLEQGIAVTSESGFTIIPWNIVKYTEKIYPKIDVYNIISSQFNFLNSENNETAREYYLRTISTNPCQQYVRVQKSISHRSQR